MNAGQVLREYRREHKLTQAQLAEMLDVEQKTILRWENGQRSLRNVDELHRISDKLGISPERFGLLPVSLDVRTPEQMNQVIDRVWVLVRDARTYQARAMIDNLIHSLNDQLTSEDQALLFSLARAYHAAGYVTSVMTRANESSLPASYYHKMEEVARIIGDPTLLNIALTYQGDMLTRAGNVTEALIYLEAARDVVQADAAARGNGVQLLGRAYLRANQPDGFDRAMKEAEELAASIDVAASSTNGQYSLGTVYEEYGRSYATLGLTKQAMDYLEKAEQALEPTKHWEILIKTARAMALVKDGEVRQGIELATDATHLCRVHGTIRLLDRVYWIKRYLSQQAYVFGNADRELGAVLGESVEY